ncbi:MAG: hypothetical protein QOH42_1096 [Blastocatellia bacterium]|jgi:hypothetical protein|nr:hypothetical protein [Blastocatellia bacterium]
MKRASIGFMSALILLLALTAATAQKTEKPWTEWSKKDADKILSNSPWAQTQTDTDTSQMFFSPTSDPRTMGASSNDSSRAAQGATNQSVNVSFHARFLSARPVRQAFVRIMELQQKPDPKLIEKLHRFAEVKWENSIIVAVTFESTDQRYLGTVMQAFNSAATGTLKNDTYLERSDGKRLFLEEYVPPSKDGFGARFIFLREMNGQPFITKDTGEVRFYTQFSNSIKVDRRFKIADMMYQGELEY